MCRAQLLKKGFALLFNIKYEKSNHMQNLKVSDFFGGVIFYNRIMSAYVFMWKMCRTWKGKKREHFLFLIVQI